MPEIAGSIPAARTRSCSSSRPGNRALNPATRVRLPYTTPALKTPSSNGPGSEIPNLRMAVRVRPESRWNHGSHEDSPRDATRGGMNFAALPRNPPRGVMGRPPSGSIGCDPGSGWFPSPTSGVQLLGSLRARQAAHLVVRPVSYAGRAGFDPLACHDDGVRSVMVAREFVNLVARVRFPPHTLRSRDPLVRMRGCRPR